MPDGLFLLDTCVKTTPGSGLKYADNSAVLSLPTSQVMALRFRPVRTAREPQRESESWPGKGLRMRAVEEAKHPGMAVAVAEEPSRLPLHDGGRWGCGS